MPNKSFSKSSEVLPSSIPVHINPPPTNGRSSPSKSRFFKSSGSPLSSFTSMGLKKSLIGSSPLHTTATTQNPLHSGNSSNGSVSFSIDHNNSDKDFQSQIKLRCNSFVHNIAYNSNGTPKYSKSDPNNNNPSVVEERRELMRLYKQLKAKEDKKKFLLDLDANIKDLISPERRIALENSIVKQPLKKTESEVFLATISGPNFDETTRCYQDYIAARSSSTYPILQNGRAGDPICDFYYVRLFEQGTMIVALADGCSWGEASKQAARRAATCFVRYLQDRLYLLSDTRKLSRVILKAFAACHSAIIEGYSGRDIFKAGTATLIGGALLPLDITNANEIAKLQLSKRHTSDPASFHISALTHLDLPSREAVNKRGSKELSPVESEARKVSPKTISPRSPKSPISSLRAPVLFPKSNPKQKKCMPKHSPRSLASSDTTTSPRQRVTISLPSLDPPKTENKKLGSSTGSSSSKSSTRDRASSTSTILSKKSKTAKHKSESLDFKIVTSNGNIPTIISAGPISPRALATTQKVNYQPNKISSPKSPPTVSKTSLLQVKSPSPRSPRTTLKEPQLLQPARVSITRSRSSSDPEENSRPTDLIHSPRSPTNDENDTDMIEDDPFNDAPSSFFKKQHSCGSNIDLLDVPKLRSDIKAKAQANEEGWVFVFGNVGDCKVFLYSPLRETVVDITHDNRNDSLDARDCGGRLGPYGTNGMPDLRNLMITSSIVKRNDLIILVTDGVHDNLDPQLLGLLPKDVNPMLTAESWDDLSPEAAQLIKSEYRERKLGEIISKSDRTPSSICDELVDHCFEVTTSSRHFMETNPSEPLPEDFDLYPGKMDHSSVVCIQVGSRTTSANRLVRDAYTRKGIAAASFKWAGIDQ